VEVDEGTIGYMTHMYSFRPEFKDNLRKPVREYQTETDFTAAGDVGGGGCLRYDVCKSFVHSADKSPPQRTYSLQVFTARPDALPTGCMQLSRQCQSIESDLTPGVLE